MKFKFRQLNGYNYIPKHESIPQVSMSLLAFLVGPLLPLALVLRLNLQVAIKISTDLLPDSSMISFLDFVGQSFIPACLLSFASWFIISRGMAGIHQKLKPFSKILMNYGLLFLITVGVCWRWFEFAVPHSEISVALSLYCSLSACISFVIIGAIFANNNSHSHVK